MMMGRPIKYTPKEIETTVLRGRYMISLAERGLADVDAEVGHTPVKGLKRFIRKEPLGIVLAISGMSSFVKFDSSLELPIVFPSGGPANIVSLESMRYFLLFLQAMQSFLNLLLKLPLSRNGFSSTMKKQVFHQVFYKRSILVLYQNLNRLLLVRKSRMLHSREVWREVPLSKKQL
jgi:hypothetical protein